MALNKYFNLQNDLNHTNEQDLIHKLVEESIQIMGIDVVYLPRELQKEDTLFGEDVISSFTETYPIEMYIESIESFEGEGDLLQKFGLAVKDEVNLTVATRRFEEETGMTVPREGDLIYFPLSKGMFEIKFVEDEQPFYPLGTLPMYKLRCELFDYSYEQIDTGDEDIDLVDRYDGVTDYDPFANNEEIETEADSVVDVDFNDQNPFGSF